MQNDASTLDVVGHRRMNTPAWSVRGHACPRRAVPLPRIAEIRTAVATTAEQDGSMPFAVVDHLRIHPAGTSRMHARPCRAVPRPGVGKPRSARCGRSTAEHDYLMSRGVVNHLMSEACRWT